MIKLINVTKKFNENIILDNTSLTINKGMYRLIGQNGSGKSTFMRMVAGLDRNYSGSINKTANSILYLTYSPIGMVPFTIKENIEILCNTYDIKPTETQWDNVRKFNNDKLDSAYQNSSTGMRAKVGLSLIFLKKWDFILIDETMSSIDNESNQMILKELNKYSNESVIIFVSHSDLSPDFIKSANILKMKERRIEYAK